MYLSRLIISNYRSIKFLDLEFSPTKNIIVGHNNAGKSNIVRALNIILGEQTPDYKKYENISERDFFNGNENELFIIGKISKEESLDIDLKNINSAGSSITLKNSLGKFYKTDFNNFIKEVFEVNFEDNSLKWASSISELEEGKKKYIKFKNVNEEELNEVKNFLNSIKKFIYVFKATNLGGIIDKNFRLILVDKENNWYLCNRAFIRNKLLVSAIIPPFRDPEYQLKPNNWNWFGKLIKSLLEKRKKDFEINSENPFFKIIEARELLREMQERYLKI